MSGRGFRGRPQPATARQGDWAVPGMTPARLSVLRMVRLLGPHCVDHLIKVEPRPFYPYQVEVDRLFMPKTLTVDADWVDRTSQLDWLRREHLVRRGWDKSRPHSGTRFKPKPMFEVTDLGLLALGERPRGPSEMIPMGWRKGLMTPSNGPGVVTEEG